MKGLKSFEAVLQQRIGLDDKSWVYKVPSVPNSQETNQAKLVKSVVLPSPTSARSSIILRLVDAPSNRVTWSEPLDHFILLSVEGFRFPTSLPTDEDPKFSTSRESSDYVCKLLTSGLSINGVCYHFFGHSNSQLKSRSCFLYASSKADIAKKVEEMGDFSKLKSVGKKAKRIGLLFSSAEMGVTLSPDRCEDIEDATYGDYNFTDGCGLISRTLAKQLAQRRNIAYRNKRYLPSVFQIRYRGYKGVLTLDPELKGNIAVQFRRSMRKFQEAKDLTLSIVDYSKVTRLYSFASTPVLIACFSHMLSDISMTRSSYCYIRLGFPVQCSRRNRKTIFSFLNRFDKDLCGMPFAFSAFAIG